MLEVLVVSYTSMIQVISYPDSGQGELEAAEKFVGLAVQLPWVLCADWLGLDGVCETWERSALNLNGVQPSTQESRLKGEFEVRYLSNKV